MPRSVWGGSSCRGVLKGAHLLKSQGKERGGRPLLYFNSLFFWHHWVILGGGGSIYDALDGRTSVLEGTGSTMSRI